MAKLGNHFVHTGLDGTNIRNLGLGLELLKEAVPLNKWLFHKGIFIFFKHILHDVFTELMLYRTVGIKLKLLHLVVTCFL
jgi:hypothetical protein